MLTLFAIACCEQNTRQSNCPYGNKNKLTCAVVELPRGRSTSTRFEALPYSMDVDVDVDVEDVSVRESEMTFRGATPRERWW